MKEIAASFMFFTRLPLWKLWDIPAESFRRVVTFWPMTGWLTGGLMSVTFLLLSLILPLLPSIAGALLSRLLLTGALHEDGLADFCDGFGGGRDDRTRILSIMKDSHIGTYGVIGLIFYFLLSVTILSELPVPIVAATLFVGDAWSKFSASLIINFLPYARKESEAKNKTIYLPGGRKSLMFSFICGGIVLVALPVRLLPSALLPIITTAIMITVMKRRIGGYTGDCCGATFLISELSFYLGILILFINHA